jgi:hypothetical protein
MARVISDRPYGLDNGALDHHQGRSDIASPVPIDIIMRRQIIQRESGYIVYAPFATTKNVPAVLDESFKNRYYLPVIGIQDRIPVRLPLYYT